MQCDDARAIRERYPHVQEELARGQPAVRVQDVQLEQDCREYWREALTKES